MMFMRPSMPVVVLCFQHIHELRTWNESRLATTSQNFLRVAKWGAIMTSYEPGIHNIRGIQDSFFKQKASWNRGPFIPGQGWISGNWNVHLHGWSLHFCGSKDLCCVLKGCFLGVAMIFDLFGAYYVRRALVWILDWQLAMFCSNPKKRWFPIETQVTTVPWTGEMMVKGVSAIMKWPWKVSIEFYVNQFMGIITV